MVEGVSLNNPAAAACDVKILHYEGTTSRGKLQRSSSLMFCSIFQHLRHKRQKNNKATRSCLNLAALYPLLPLGGDGEICMKNLRLETSATKLLFRKNNPSQTEVGILHILQLLLTHVTTIRADVWKCKRHNCFEFTKICILKNDPKPQIFFLEVSNYEKHRTSNVCNPPLLNTGCCHLIKETVCLYMDWAFVKLR